MRFRNLLVPAVIMGLTCLSVADQVDATGGAVSYHTTNGVTYRIHAFTEVGPHDFHVIRGGEVEYLLVAGGGGGGRTAGATSGSGPGGGAGGMLMGTVAVADGTHQVVVGVGGRGGGPATDDYATSGSNSFFGGIIAVGGGLGPWWQNSGGNGGSGGGAGGNTIPYFAVGGGIPGQGHDGGPSGRVAGAGGGAGEPGESRTLDEGRGSHGGIGLVSDITGTAVYYAGGGASGGVDDLGGAGGLGGGGDGGAGSEPGLDGADGFGGGGGGAGCNRSGGTAANGGRGGSGIVVIRYPVLSITVTKEYDGNNTIVAGQCQLNGVAPGDTVTLASLAGSYSAGKNVQTDGPLSLTQGPILGGPDGDKYSVAPPVVGSITPKQLSITVTKEYDGNDSIFLEQCQLNGVIPDDTVTLASLDGVYTDGRHVQTDGPINLPVWPTLAGPDSHNYTVAAPATGTISPANLTVFVTKIFDGNHYIRLEQCSLDGIISGDSVTLAVLEGTYNLGAGAQTAGPLTITDGPVLDGTDAGNYSAPPPATGDISVFLYTVQDEATITITSYVGNEDSVTLPGTLADKPVTRIAGNAFAGHAGLITVEIPAGITNIAGNAFTDARGLNEIMVDGGNQFYSSVDGVLFDKAGEVLLQYPGARAGEYSMPDTVLNIAEKSFFGCSGLSLLEIPAGLTNISRFAFYQCAGLRSLHIPGTVMQIGASAFQDCSGLVDVTFGDGNFNLDEWVFAGCGSLTSVLFGGRVEYLGYRAFHQCAGLRGVYFVDDAPSHGLGLFNGADSVRVYYRQGTAGWGAFYAERPTTLWLDAVASPVFSPDGGTYPEDSVAVNVTCSTVQATIHYTINGDDPTPESPEVVSGGPVVMPVPGRLKARAYHAVIAPSVLKTAAYQAADEVTVPSFSPDGGAHAGSSVEVSVTCSTPGVILRFTTDGSMPNQLSPAVTPGGAVQVTLPGTLRARAWRADLRPSPVKTAVFTRRSPVPDPPDPDPDYPEPTVGPSLRANGRRGELVLSYPSLVSVTVTTQYAQDAGLPADWWAVAIPDYGNVWYYLNYDMQWVSFPGGEPNLFMCRPVFQGPLMTMSDPVVLLPPTILPRGVYYIHFAVDQLDGVLNRYLLWDNDMVKVVVE